jgi:hypothetical protein
MVVYCFMGCENMAVLLVTLLEYMPIILYKCIFNSLWLW